MSSPPAPPSSPGPPPDDRTAPSTDVRRQVGRWGEHHARRHLERLGFRLLAERARTRWGEIDLIVYDGRTIVFCEVKARIARPGATPWTSLHARKQRQVRRLAVAWLTETPDRPRGADIRFDAIGVLLDPTGALRGIDHLEAAF